MVEKKGLGKGLSALLGEAEASYDQSLGTRALLQPRAEGEPFLVAVEHLRAGKFQPRRVFDEEAIASLAESIRERGVLQPIIVRHDRDAVTTEKRYEIIAGERRWRAAKKAALRDVPVIVRNLSDREAMEVALVENLQRQDLNPFEEAEGYQRLMNEFGHTQEALARSLGRSRSLIANTLRLLSLPDEIRRMVESGQLSAGHARTLIGVENAVELAQKIISEGLNVRQAEKASGAAKGREKQPRERRKGEQQQEVDEMAASLSERLGVEVGIRLGRGGAGKIIISFKNFEEFDTILHRMTLGG